jgi:polyisoprenoid-binding protein YceI
MRLGLTVRADSLELVDNVRPADRQEIEGTMRQDVLETAAFPEVAFASDEVSSETVARGRYRVQVGGRLSLHGVVRAHPVAAELVVFDDGLRLRGESPLALSDYRIRPVTAVGGAIKLRDVLRVSFDLAAVPEGS